MTAPRPGTAGKGWTAEERALAVSQVELARDGCAAGQCPDCGSFRTDGELPLLHDADCPSAAHTVKVDTKVKGHSKDRVGVAAR